MGKRNVASLADHSGIGHQLVERLRRREMQLIKDLLVRPDPVGPVDVNGHRHPVTVDLRESLDRTRHELVPSLFRRDRIEVGQKILRCVLGNRKAEHLDGVGRITGCNPSFQYRARCFAAAPCDRRVLPCIAPLLQTVL